MSTSKVNQINEDGLRYKDKESGVPFSGWQTTSCVKCGVHKPRTEGNFQHKFGGRLFFCFECKPPKNKST